MAHISVTKGLNIPILGKPEGDIQARDVKIDRVALDLTEFEEIRFQLLVEVGNNVKIGQPLVIDKDCPQRAFVSPASGTILEIERGEKRRVRKIIIACDAKEEQYARAGIALDSSSPQELAEKLAQAGAFAHIRSRPFGLLANPMHLPRDIFVKAVESVPFAPKAEWQVQGFEEAFAIGLQTLSKFTRGIVHLVHHKNSDYAPFMQAQHVEKHTTDGLHPCGNISVAIHHIAPIKHINDVVWTLNARDVVVLGQIVARGEYHTELVVGVAGDALKPSARGFFKSRQGALLRPFVEGHIADLPYRLISGDVLTGKQTDVDSYLRFEDQVISVIPESEGREFLYFFRAGGDKFTATKTYLSGMFHSLRKLFSFSTNMHGEERGLIDATIYDDVMPMNIPTMHLIKAVMAQDYDLAQELGLLEVVPEDFALATFICPSKVEMMDVMHRGIRSYAQLVHA